MAFLGTGWRRVIIIALIAIAFIIVLYSLLGRTKDDEPDIPLSDVIERARNGEVTEIEVRGVKLTVTLTDGREFDSRKERDTSIIDTLERSGVDVGGPDGVVVDVKRGGALGSWIGLVISFLPLALFAAILYFAIHAAVRRRD